MSYSNLRRSPRGIWAGGRWRGRGSSISRSSRSTSVDVSQPAQATPPPPLGTLLQSISVDDIVYPGEQQVKDARITDCKLVASYNWMEKSEPSIIVPGMPPKWTPPSPPPELSEDKGTYYYDRNSASYPDHPMEPAAEAVMRLNHGAQHTNFNEFSEIDVVACSSTLGNLRRFTQGEDKPFRMLVEVIGQTVHLIRRENSPKEVIPDVRGHGHTFPEAYTTWDPAVRGSSSHQRILRYSFGGLTYLTRSGGDGYLPDKTGSNNIQCESPRTRNGSSGSLDDLTSSLAEHGVSSGASLTTPSQSRLQISSAGATITQEALFDLKTRSIYLKRMQDDIQGRELPRLWVAQIPNLVLAYHKSGKFTDIEVLDMRSSISAWETENQAELKLFARLLRRIVDAARARADGRLEIVHRDGDKVLELREQTPNMPPAFSSDTMKRWTRWLGTAVEPSTSDKSEAESSQGQVEGSLDGEGDVRDDIFDWSGGSEEEGDYTACDKECGYCGRCKYGRTLQVLGVPRETEACPATVLPICRQLK